MTVQRKIHGYGWKPDLPDHRDHIFNLQRRVKQPWELPRLVDLEPQMPPVYDQLQLGSCTGNGWAAIMEYEAIRAGQAMDTPSRLFIYYNERLLENTVSSDSGAEIRSGAKVVATVGAPPETDWPYDISQFAVQPPVTAFDDAKKLEAVAYERVVVGPGAPMCTALAGGHPIVFGFPVPDYFESGWDPTHAPLDTPGPDSQIVGGHCMVIVGYDFTHQEFPEPVFKVRNSWGSSWGSSGYCYFSYRWFVRTEKLAGDMWVVTKVS